MLAKSGNEPFNSIALLAMTMMSQLHLGLWVVNLYKYLLSPHLFHSSFSTTTSTNNSNSSNPEQLSLHISSPPSQANQQYNQPCLSSSPTRTRPPLLPRPQPRPLAPQSMASALLKSR